MKDPKELFRERTARLNAAIRLEKPDRVPLIPQVMAFPLFYSGITFKDAMHDYTLIGPALDKYHQDFPTADLGWGPGLVYSASVLEAAGISWLKWPGNGIEEENEIYQYVEGEYMRGDEYDAFLHDPTRYIQNIWLPRSFSKLKGLSHLNLGNSVWLNWMRSFSAFANPELLEAVEVLKNTANELMKWFAYIGEYEDRLENEMGFPVAAGAYGFAPFDCLGDTMRGTVNIMMDIYDRPEKLLAAVEKFIPIAIEGPVSDCKQKGVNRCWVWLHKGVDDFMSDEQYRTFYWPGLKALIEGLVAEEITPIVYCEGKYNNRLEILRDVPKGKVIYDFENTDMFRAKEVLGDVACIAGNVPNAMLAYGSPSEIDEYCKKLIMGIGRDGGFMLDAGAIIDNAKPANMMAFYGSVEKYG